MTLANLSDMSTKLMSNNTWSDHLTENTTFKFECTTKMAPSQFIPTGYQNREDITFQTIPNFDWIFALVIIPCLSLPGILGNVSSMIVLYRHGFKRTSNILLMALTFADACYLVGVNNVASYVHDYSGTQGFPYSVNVCYFLYGLYRIYFFLELWGNWCSLTLPVLITFERLVAVYFPFEFPIIVTTKRIWTAVFIIFIFWIPINVYYFFLEDLVFIEEKGQRRGLIAGTRLYKDPYYQKIYFSVSRAAIVLTEPISVFLVIVGCILVGVKVKAASVKRRKMMSAVVTVAQKSVIIPASRTTCTLMLVCIVYTITIGSAFFIQLTVTKDRDSRTDRILSTMVRFVKCLHSSCNFFIYIYVNRNFRETYRHIFGSMANRIKRQDSSFSNRASQVKGFS